MADIKNKQTGSPLLYFVGNKCDLEDQRAVSHEMIKERLKEETYYEVSAMNGENVFELFQEISEKRSGVTQEEFMTMTQKSGCC